MGKRTISLILALCSGWGVMSGQDIFKVGAVFGSGMVIQQNETVPVWGTAAPDARVALTTSWTDEKFTARADEEGRWECFLPTVDASYESHWITIKSGRNTITLNDVRIGEVWLCSGQSNMEMRMGPDYRQNMVIENADTEIASADYPEIHFMNVQRNEAYEPVDEIVTDGWKKCSPETVPELSAVAYYFAVKLQQEMDVPVGLLMVPYGGSPIQAWLPESATRSPLYDAEKQRIAASKESGAPKPNFNMISSLYNGMLSPVAGYGIKGFLWYQGESNVSESARYPEMMHDLVSSWRRCWQNEDLPFYQVQLAPYIYPLNELGMWANLAWAQQIAADNIENCRLVVTIDLGDDHNIHPSKKKAVGERLAAVALNDTYGRTEIQCCFPEVESVTRIGEQEIKVKFRNVYDGLHFEGAWNEFEVSSDGVLYARPECSAEGDDVLVFKTNIDSIKYLRYCWRDNCRPNLYNSAGLPAGPFYIKVP